MTYVEKLEDEATKMGQVDKLDKKAEALEAKAKNEFIGCVFF